MTTPINFGTMYHTGIVVKDVDAAMAEYSDIMGVSFGLQGEQEMPVWMPSGARTMNFRFAYTAEGPHRLELVRETPGTLWTMPGVGHAHHLGYWCDDVPAATAELVQRGVPIAAKVGVSDPDEDAAIVLFQAKSGIYLELISSEMRSVMFPED
jgi:hypothetical protein